jgi:hypothetical protein
MSRLRGEEAGGVNAPAPEPVAIAKWINSDALKLGDLRGKGGCAALLDVWLH